MVSLSRVRKALSAHAAIDLARDEMLYMCGVQDRSCETLTPRSFRVSTGLNESPLDME